ncbi:MAG: nucleoside monophosphate kinase [Deltaproteobacteria bacterium]|nr:nucleoside monophosphate kinase [Deltaproteobacteria bacterium]
MTTRTAHKIILVGAPGAGKGTVAKGLVDRFGLTHLSTGDMLRAAVAAGSQVGLLAKTFMDRGALVPDDVMVKLISERVQQPDCRNTDGSPRFLLDGFPRTLPQADALAAEGLAPDLVLFIDVPNESVVRRLSGRRTCPACGNVHHVEFAPPLKDGVCDRCGGTLVHRSDDHDATIRKRLDAFAAQTAPLVQRYGTVIEKVDGNQPPEIVLKAAVAVLRRHGNAGEGTL